MSAQLPQQGAPETSSLETLSALWRKHGSKLLLIFAAAMLVFAGVRYKRNQDAQRNVDVQTALSNAWRGVDQIQSQQFSVTPSTPMEIAMRQTLENDVNQAVQVVQDSAAPTDTARLANASLARGEMFWALAHMPPEAPSTQPASQPAASQPARDYLGLAAAAYDKIVSDYAAQIEPYTLARFGLAAVAEDRRDIAAARTQYQAVIDNAATSPPDKSMAETRLAALNELEKPLLLLPATQPVAAAVTTPSLSSLANLNFGPSAPAPTTAPAAPATRP